MAWISFGALPCRKKKTWWQHPGLSAPCLAGGGGGNLMPAPRYKGCCCAEGPVCLCVSASGIFCSKLSVTKGDGNKRCREAWNTFLYRLFSAFVSACWGEWHNWRRVGVGGRAVCTFLNLFVEQLKWLLILSARKYGNCWMHLRWTENSCVVIILTLILPTWRIWWAPNNASRWDLTGYLKG